MSFPHEELQNSILSYERKIIKDKEKLKDRKYIQKHSLKYDLAQLCDFLPFEISFYDYNWCWNFSIIEKITSDTYESFWNEFEEILNINHYYIDIDKSADDEYVFIKDSKDKIIIRIVSSVCNRVKTGKMIPEIKTNCNFIKE